MLQGGDCAESFKEFKADNIRDSFRVLLQMAVTLMFGGQKPVVKVMLNIDLNSDPHPCVIHFHSIGSQVGRMAGQFAKPRSSPNETRDGITLPSYRGDNVNGDEFTPEARVPSPDRMLKAYYQCSSTLNLLRAFATGGYASMQRVSQWNLDFIESSEQSEK